MEKENFVSRDRFVEFLNSTPGAHRFVVQTGGLIGPSGWEVSQRSSTLITIFIFISIINKRLDFFFFFLPSFLYF